MTSISSPLFSANQSSFSLSNGFASTVFLHLSQTACMGFMYATVRSQFKQRKRNLPCRNCREAERPAWKHLARPSLDARRLLRMDNSGKEAAPSNEKSPLEQILEMAEF